MKVDFHIHTRELSGCSRASAREQIQAAVAAGLDVIAFTDHGQFQSADDLARLNAEYAPIRILDGIELVVDGEDVLVIGVRHPAIEMEAWTYPRLHGFVRERGGFMVIAHPFRYHPELGVDIAGFPPDAIEVYSSNTPSAAAERILDVARRHRIPVVCNSDAHACEYVGRYFNRLDAAPRGDPELFDMLRRGRFSAVTCDAEKRVRVIDQRAILGA